VASIDRPSREAISFAFVADAFTRTNDALRGLAPLFESTIAKRAGALFDAASVAAEINTQFDLNVSPLVVEGLVPALVDEGLLRKVVGTSEDVLYRCQSREARGEKSATAEKVEAIFEKFRAFASKALESHSLKASDDAFDQKLLEVISTTDFLHLALRNDQSMYRGRILALKKEIVIDIKDATAQAMDSVAAQFISDCLETDRASFDLLVHAAWGALIAEVILSLQHPKQQDITKLTIFLDGPLILDLLDIGSKEGHAYAVDLFDLLRRSGARLATFGHVLEEMIGAITTPLERLAQGEPASGPLIRRLQSEPGHLTYVRMVISTLSSKLEEKHIEILDDSTFETPELEIFFSEDDVNSLRNAIGDPHFNVERRDRDAKSVAYVTRLRRGIAPQSVSEAGAVFVTRNAVLAREAQKQLNRVGKLPAFSAPVCLTDRQIAGVLWFCCGGGGQALTMLKLVANCAQAVVPRTDLVSQVAQHLFDTNPARMPEFEALLRDKRASMCLIRETLGVASFATAENAEKLLEQMKNELTAEARKTFQANLEENLREQELRHRSEVLDQQMQAAQQLQEREQRAQELESRLNAAAKERQQVSQIAAEETFTLTQRLQQAQQLLDRVEANAAVERAERLRMELERKQRLEGIAETMARCVEFMAAILLSAGVYFSILAAVKGVGLTELGIYPTLVAALATAVLAIAGWFGWTRTTVRLAVRNRLNGAFEKWFG